MAEKRREHRRSYRSELHHTGNNHLGQRIDIWCSGKQHGGHSDQCNRDADGERCAGRALDHNFTHESDRDGRADCNLHGSCGGDSSAQLPMAEKRREHRRSYRSELHHAGNNHLGQRIDIWCSGKQHGGHSDQCNRDADGERCAGRALDHNFTHESDRDGRADCNLHGGCGGDSSAQLPMAEKRREHRRSNGGELHHAGNNHLGQRIDIWCSGKQHGGHSGQCSRDADGERCSGRALDHNFTHESDCHGRADCNLHGGCGGDSSAQLPMAEKRREYRRSNRSELHHAGDNHLGQRIDIWCSGKQHGGHSGQCNRDADGERCAGRALDHNFTHESDRDGRADCNLHGGCGGDSSAQLPMAEKRREHRRSNGGELHDAGDSHLGQRIDIWCSGKQHGGHSGQCNRDADGERCAGRALDHNFTHESDCDGRADCNLHGGCGGDSSAQLPMAEKRREHRRSYRSELHHTGDNHLGQRIDIWCSGKQHGGHSGQCNRDADGERCAGRALDHNLTHESDRDGRADCNLHGGCGGDSSAQLPMAEKRREHRRSNGSELHHAGDNHLGQRIDIWCSGKQHGGHSGQCSRDADGERCAGRAFDHNFTHESDCDGRADSNLHGGCGGDSSAQLPMAEKRREHRRSNGGELHHAGDNHLGQRIDIWCSGKQHGGHSGQCNRDADGERCSGRAFDHNFTHESDRDGRADCNLHGGCGGDSSAQLPMAEKRREHRRSNGGELHHAGDNHLGQRIDIWCSGKQHGGHSGQCNRDADGERCAGRTLDHNFTHESDRDGRADCNLHGGCGGDSSAQLPMAEKRREHRRSNGSELHHAGDNHVGQRIDICRSGEQHGGHGDQCSRDADGERCSGRAFDHNFTHESDCDGRTECNLHGGCGRNGTAQLPVAEERREYRRSHLQRVTRRQ